MPGVKGLEMSAITIADIDLMHRIRKGQFDLAGLGVQGQAAPAIWSAHPGGLKSARPIEGRLLVTAPEPRPASSVSAQMGRQPAGYSDAPPSMATSAPVM
jgi:hypothetical protein